MATDGSDESTEHESTEHMIEGTREAREAAEEAVADVHEDAEDLEARLEDEGPEPGSDADDR